MGGGITAKNDWAPGLTLYQLERNNDRKRGKKPLIVKKSDEKCQAKKNGGNKEGGMKNAHGRGGTSFP